MSEQVTIRAFSTPWKLVRRVALVTLVSVVICNFLFWLASYFAVLGFRRDFLSPQNLGEAIMVAITSSAVWSLILIPLATLTVAPIVWFGTLALSKHLSESAAVLMATALAIAAFLLAAYIFFWVNSSHNTPSAATLQSFWSSGFHRLVIAIGGISLTVAGFAFALTRKLWK